MAHRRRRRSRESILLRPSRETQLKRQAYHFHPGALLARLICIPTDLLRRIRESARAGAHLDSPGREEELTFPSLSPPPLVRNAMGRTADILLENEKEKRNQTFESTRELNDLIARRVQRYK